MNFACALIRGALQVGYTDLSFSRKTSLYFIMPIPLTARISISDPALLPICHLQKVRCEPGLAYYNETTTSLNSDSSISYFLYPEHPLFAPIEDRHDTLSTIFGFLTRSIYPCLKKVFPFIVRGFLVPGLFVIGFISRSSSSTAIFV